MFADKFNIVTTVYTFHSFGYWYQIMLYMLYISSLMSTFTIWSSELQDCPKVATGILTVQPEPKKSQSLIDNSSGKETEERCTNIGRRAASS